MADGTVGIKQSAGADRLIDNEVLEIGGQDVYRQRVSLPKVEGNWSYYAGSSGTVNVAAGERVIGLAAHSLIGGTMTIDGGDTLPVPANSGVAIAPMGNLEGPQIVFTDTDSYFVEVVS